MIPEIYNDCVHFETDHETVSIPQPTLLFFKLYRDRRGYIDDPDHGLGRLLTILKRQKEPGYLRALRAGTDIPDEEAAEASKGINPEDRDYYYYAVKYALRYGNRITEEKTKILLAKRLRVDAKDLDKMLNFADTRPA